MKRRVRENRGKELNSFYACSKSIKTLESLTDATRLSLETATSPTHKCLLVEFVFSIKH